MARSIKFLSVVFSKVLETTHCQSFGMPQNSPNNKSRQDVIDSPETRHRASQANTAAPTEESDAARLTPPLFLDIF